MSSRPRSGPSRAIARKEGVRGGTRGSPTLLAHASIRRRRRACLAGRLSAKETVESSDEQPAPERSEPRDRPQGGGPWANQGFPHVASAHVDAPPEASLPRREAKCERRWNRRVSSRPRSGPSHAIARKEGVRGGTRGSPTLPAHASIRRRRRACLAGRLSAKETWNRRVSSRPRGGPSRAIARKEGVRGGTRGSPALLAHRAQQKAAAPGLL